MQGVTLAGVTILYFLGHPRMVFTACLSSQDYIDFHHGTQVVLYLPTNLAETCALASAVPQVSVYQNDVILYFLPLVDFVALVYNSFFSRWHTDKPIFSYQCKP